MTTTTTTSVLTVIAMTLAACGATAVPTLLDRPGESADESADGGSMSAAELVDRLGGPQEQPPTEPSEDPPPVDAVEEPEESPTEPVRPAEPTEEAPDPGPTDPVTEPGTDDTAAGGDAPGHELTEQEAHEILEELEAVALGLIDAGLCSSEPQIGGQHGSERVTVTCATTQDGAGTTTFLAYEDGDSAQLDACTPVNADALVAGRIAVNFSDVDQLPQGTDPWAQALAAGVGLVQLDCAAVRTRLEEQRAERVAETVTALASTTGCTPWESSETIVEGPFDVLLHGCTRPDASPFHVVGTLTDVATEIALAPLAGTCPAGETLAALHLEGVLVLNADDADGLGWAASDDELQELSTLAERDLVGHVHQHGCAA